MLNLSLDSSTGEPNIKAGCTCAMNYKMLTCVVVYPIFRIRVTCKYIDEISLVTFQREDV